MSDDLAYAPAHELLTLLGKQEVTSVDLVEMYLARLDKHNTRLNAVITLDAERALAEAAAADAAAARGDAQLGPLHGLPITIKDSYETAGMRTSCGRTDLAHHVPAVDAEAVARLRRAGAVIMGKTNMPAGNMDVQADNKLYGPTNNPWDLGRTSGGSAGGGSVASAAGLTSLDIGSEIGGSTRVPAHYNGVYGHKVTFRSVPLVGHISPGPGVQRWSEPDLACSGAQTRHPRDFVPVLKALTGTLARDGGFSYRLDSPRATELSGFRVAVWTEDPDCPIDSDVRRAVDLTVAALRDAGASVDSHPASLPVTIAESQSVFEPLLYGQLGLDRSQNTPAMLSAMGARMAQNPRGDAARAARGSFLTHYAWMKVDGRRMEIRERWTRFFENYDIVLMPVTGTAAIPHHRKLVDRFGRPYRVDGQERSYWDQVRWSAVANVSGSPATAFPVTQTASGLPVGLQAMGPMGGDLTTIEFAALLGERLGGYRRPPVD
ncbi:amidase [Rhodococcus sp. 05-2254-6]|uniref:amidase n=1 Tax=Nocardiaceae TaxID=85025 RepID=UPI00056588C0|nr:MULTISPECIES: amidase [Rhodococcus]OZE22866.1 amidase [Rhodococcus sp. 05-2254-6]OZE88399.1 amidase [Rhodococcus sp. 15-649-2-2]OZE99152.1 amidase [Rhodococcus sp. 15-2388-1-1a]